MNQPLTAGDRLARDHSRRRPERDRTTSGNADAGAPNAAGPNAAGPNAGGHDAGGPGAPPPPVAKPPRRRRHWLARLTGAVFGVAALGVAATGAAGFVAYRHYSAELPDVDGLLHYQPRQMSRVYAGDSRLLSELATERRIFVPYTAIPDVVKRAFVSAEDQNFFTHKGVDPVAILRAAVTDISQYGQGRRPKGASTITQQVAKNMLVGSEVSMSRKIREGLLAIRIERTLTKDRILELYLNEIYLGLGSYGVAAAAQSYFNKSLDELTIPEAAFLAALPKGPNNYNPYRFPDAAKERRDWVMDRMVEEHAISVEQAQGGKATPIAPAAYQRPEMVTGADYFAEEVRRQLVQKFGDSQTTQGGLTVRTSLDPALQAAADKTLRDGLMKFDQAHGGWRGPVAHLESGTALKANWPTALAGVGRPSGMLPDWRLAVVIEIGDRDARIGLLDRTAAGAAPIARTGTMSVNDLGWARPVRDGKIGASPRRIGDVMQPGDVVMVEPPAPPPPNASGRPAAVSDRLYLRQIPAIQGALVSMDPATGRVLAMSGGWSYELSQFNRATQALRQPGSSFKPFVYLTAMEQDISPSQKFADSPFVLDLGSAGKWKPNNYELDFNGPTPVRIALEKSLNLVTVRIADHIGMEQVAQTAIGFHVVDNMPRVLPASLGAVDTTVLRMAAAYSGLDSGGKEVLPTVIDSVQDRDGHVIWRAPAIACDNCGNAELPPALLDKRHEVADADSTFQVVNMMQGVVARGTGIAAGKGLDRPVAGKTGTTQDFNDAWFVGFTPDLVTAVWIGYDTPTSLGKDETGGAIAAPIWHDFMAIALKGRPVLKFVPPPGVTMANWDSGYGNVTDAFKPGQEPGASVSLDSTNFNTSAAADNGGTSPAPAAPVVHSAGVDTGLGGLY